MNRVYLASYATDRFESVRQELDVSARDWGITNHFAFKEQDLVESTFYRQNRSILDEECGAGYWAWKPYFILKGLEQISAGETLVYADAGSRFLQSPAPLLDICAQRPDGLLVFDARPLTNEQFTKRDCFVELGCDHPEMWQSTKAIATLLVIRKCDRSLEFLNEWQKHCQRRSMITDDPNQCGKPNLPGFLQHRHDQAIISLMAARDHIETYRNPTIWGNYLKMPQFREHGERIPSPYGLLPAVHAYSKSPQLNSPYGTIFEINRAPNEIGKQPFPPHAFSFGEQDRLSMSSLRALGGRILRRAKVFRP